MAMVTDQQQQQVQVHKHYCRICKKGFGCGRALGGHMRAHGINDDATTAQAETDVDPSAACGEWDDKGGNPQAGSKRMYALRTNPNRLKSCRVCENCGKEFVSWKSFLEHGKCSSDDEGGDGGGDSMSSSPRSEGEDDAVRGCAGWSKGKRSRRAKTMAVGVCSTVNCPSSEEEDLANCLVMLSAARSEPIITVAEAEESCASASKDEDQRRNAADHRQTATISAADKCKAPMAAPAVPRGMFECKACKKVFSSHQALGGHRASHKKVKGCFAAKQEDVDEAAQMEEEVITHDHNNGTTSEALALAIMPLSHHQPLAVAPLKKKSKVHECSICHRVFASGQALGGHKRCHWITSNSADPNTLIMKPGHHQHQNQPQLQLRPMFECSEPPPLDLNLPAPVDSLAVVQQDMIGGSPLRLEVPATLYLQPWLDHSNNTNKNNNTTTSSNNNKTVPSNYNNEISNQINAEDEADSKIKLAKLNELKDINMGGDPSPWLQMGIGSPPNETSEP